MNNTKIPSVRELRKQGYKVHINHYRYLGNTFNEHDLSSYFHIRNEKWQSRVSPKGGLTTIEVFGKDGAKVCDATAKCSIKDMFNRKVALQICLGRLYSKMTTV